MRAPGLLSLMATFIIATQMGVRADPLRLAEAGSPDLKNLIDAVAYAHMKERGVDSNVVYLKSDDIATQAIISKQVDIVVSSLGYAQIQALDAPFRHFMQLRNLRFYPLVAADFAHSWQEMNGKDFVVHARGSGTEIAALAIEKQNNIRFSNFSYMPNSQVRANAMLHGIIKATLVDIEGLQYIQSKAPGKFVVLPFPDLPVSEAALYADKDFLASHRDQVEVLVEELLKAFRASAHDANYIAAERARLNLYPDLSPGRIAQISSYYSEAAKQNVYPLDGGGEAAADNDLRFYSQVGILKGAPRSLHVGDFWNFDILHTALSRLGRAPTAMAKDR